MKKIIIICAFLGLIDVSHAKIIVSAASSIQGALSAILELYQQQNNAEVLLNFGASGILAQQIATGAKVDLFISANSNWVEYIEKKGFLEKKPTYLISNKIVLAKFCKSKLKVESVTDLTKVSLNKIAVADFSYVPLGSYTKNYLSSLKILQQLKDSLLFATSAEHTAQYLKRGLVDVAFIYYSSAFLESDICIVEELSDDLIGKVDYKIAVIKKNKETSFFSNFLHSNSAVKIFVQYGFLELTKK